MCVCVVFLHKWKYFLNARIRKTYIPCVALFGNPTLNSMTQHIIPSVPECQGDSHVVGFGDQGVDRILRVFGCEREKEIVNC